MNNDENFGQQWMLEELRSLASEANLSLNSADWQTDADDLRRNPQTTKLIVVVAGRRFVETFTVADLEDVRQDSGVQHALRTRLEVLVAQASSE